MAKKESRLRALPIMASGIGFRFFLDCTVKSGKMATGRRLFELRRPAARRVGGPGLKPPAATRRRPPKSAGREKISLIPGRFSFIIYREFLYEEVILVHRSLFFTPLKS